MKKVLAGIVLLLIIITVIIFIVPEHGPSKERVVAAELMVCASSMRSEIETSLLNKMAVPQKITSACANPPSKYWATSHFEIMQNGSIIVVNKELNITLNLVPSVTGSSVTWSCYGSPKKFMPAPCRDHT